MLQPVENLLAKYFAGEADNKETEAVMQWKKENPLLFESYRKTYHARFFETKSFLSKRPKRITKSRILYPGWLLRTAAVFIGLLVLGTALYFYSQSLSVRFENNTASVQHIVLPDGSEVFLDKKAILQYRKSFWGQFRREVSMKGRIFFHVFHDPSRPFTVCAGKTEVRVLGTRFTVNQMTAKTQVVLTHGKVLVTSAKINRNIILDKTGDQVILKNDGQIKKNRVKASLYASWLKKKIFFNDCTVKDVVNMLNDSYNLNVVIRNPVFLNKKLFGSAPSDDPELIVNALSQILHTEIQTQ